MTTQGTISYDPIVSSTGEPAAVPIKNEEEIDQYETHDTVELQRTDPPSGTGAPMAESDQNEYLNDVQNDQSQGVEFSNPDEMLTEAKPDEHIDGLSGQEPGPVEPSETPSEEKVPPSNDGETEEVSSQSKLYSALSTCF